MASWERGYGDFHLTPDLATLRRIPWLEGTALVLCDVDWEDGSPVVASPRQVLRRQVERAREAAGERDVAVAGGASAIQQALGAGLVDEMQVHVAPILLGGGTRLFGEGADPVRLEPKRLLGSPRATHVTFDVLS